MLKGEDRPVNRENDRSFMLAALRCVDDVVVFGEETPEKLLTHLKPDILVKGGIIRQKKLPEGNMQDLWKFSPLSMVIQQQESLRK